MGTWSLGLASRHLDDKPRKSRGWVKASHSCTRSRLLICKVRGVPTVLKQTLLSGRRGWGKQLGRECIGCGVAVRPRMSTRCHPTVHGTWLVYPKKLRQPQSS